MFGVILLPVAWGGGRGSKGGDCWGLRQGDITLEMCDRRSGEESHEACPRWVAQVGSWWMAASAGEAHKAIVEAMKPVASGFPHRTRPLCSAYGCRQLPVSLLCSFFVP